MARKDNLLGVAGAETIIGTGVRIKGTLVSDGDITLDGRLVGEIRCKGNASLGVNSQVKGNIQAVNLQIAGRVDGNITAEGEVAISETGQLHGDVVCTQIAISPGAIFIGRNQMAELTAHEMPDEPTST